MGGGVVVLDIGRGAPQNSSTHQIGSYYKQDIVRVLVLMEVVGASGEGLNLKPGWSLDTIQAVPDSS